MVDWSREQSKAFRIGIELVMIDPSAPYASGVRIAVDTWHLVALANQMVTQARQRVTARCPAFRRLR